MAAGEKSRWGRTRGAAVRSAAALAIAVTATVPPWGRLSAAAAQPPSQRLWPAPRAQQPATAPAAAPAAPVPVDVTGADTIEYDAATEEYTFIGAHVIVTRGDQRLEAPEIRYDGARRRAVLPRRGTLTTPTMGIDADTLTADLGTRHVLAEGDVHGRFLDQGVWATVTAARIEADDRPDLRRVDASGLPGPRPEPGASSSGEDAVVVRGDEELRGRRIVYDRSSQHGSVDGRALALRGGDRLEADHIEGDLGTRDGEATGHVVLDRAATHMHGTADRATYSGAQDTVVLTGHAVVTRDGDRMEADRITVHLRDNTAVADGHSKIVAYPTTASP